jgi:hypothetical protein
MGQKPHKLCLNHRPSDESDGKGLHWYIHNKSCSFSHPTCAIDASIQLLRNQIVYNMHPEAGSDLLVGRKKGFKDLAQVFLGDAFSIV